GRSRASPACSARCPATARRRAGSCRRSVLGWGPQRSWLAPCQTLEIRLLRAGSRLHAAAGALFPPKGEKPKASLKGIAKRFPGEEKKSMEKPKASPKGIAKRFPKIGT